MNARKTAQLEAAITALQDRWGSQAVYTLRETATPLEGIPTGFAALDALTGANGIPVGYVSAVTGTPSSGATTLAYRLAAATQRQLRTTIWLDTNRVFDPASARAARVDFQHLLLSRPPDWPRALAVTRDVAEHLLHALIVLALPLDSAPEDARLLADLLRVLPAICHRNDNTVVLLHGGPDWGRWQGPVMQRAALVTRLARTGWLPDMAGITAHATLLKNKFAPPGPPAALQIVYPELP